MVIGGNLVGYMALILLVIIAIVAPAVLTIINLAALFRPKIKKKLRRRSWVLTVLLGVILTSFYAMLMEIDFRAVWSEQLANRAMHQPFWEEAWPIYLVITCTALAGFLVLETTRFEKLPPLMAVLCIAALYPFAVTCVVWCVQVANGSLPGHESYPFDLWAFPLMLFPINLLIMMITLIRNKVLEWNAMEDHDQSQFGKNRVIRAINQSFRKAERWPVWGLFLSVPLLGLMLLILLLFGQQPDKLIKAWTETAEWTLSQKTPPPQVYYDEHYLCTAAACGHRKLVKPLRMGERRGHRVVVNRQLEIANAFEQVLEERVPRFHKAVRYIYDRYGFPLARFMKTKLSCDLVYLLMKPLEWFFLTVLYLTDVRPENRITVQYLPGYRNIDLDRKPGS